MKYTGRLKATEQEQIAIRREDGASVRKIAKAMNLPYGKVRGFIESLEKSSGAPREPTVNKPKAETGPHILIYDIETTPILGWSWRYYEDNFLKVEKDSKLLCFAYKWVGEDAIHFVRDNVVSHLHKLFDLADVIVAHNNDKFDEKKANAFFLRAGLGPPSPYQRVDTVKVARKYFGSSAASLKELTREYGLSRKLSTEGIKLWFDCMDNDPAAWEKMSVYNVQDVKSLEELYLLLRPWMVTGHPNAGFWQRGVTVCNVCGSKNLQARGIRRTSVSEYQSFQCQDCKHYGRLRTRVPQHYGRGPRLT